MFYWQGRNLEKMGDLINAVLNCKSREEAQAFMRAYRAVAPNVANQNIGYMTGYFSREEATRVLDWFGVSHPIWGTSFPTPEEAFAAGLKIGELSKQYGAEKAMQMLGYGNSASESDNPWHIGISDILGDFTQN